MSDLKETEVKETGINKSNNKINEEKIENHLYIISNASDERNKCCLFDFYKSIWSNSLNKSSDMSSLLKQNKFPRSTGDLTFPRIEAFADESAFDNLPKVRIIRLTNSCQLNDIIDCNDLKKKKLNDWKLKKEDLKKMINLEVSKDDLRLKTNDAFIHEIVLPREILMSDNTEDELFLKIESGSVTTVNTIASNQSKFEKKLKDTKKNYLDFQSKAIKKIKNIFVQKPKTNKAQIQILKTNYDESALKNENMLKANRSKPPRPPIPRLINPKPIRPIRKKQISKLNVKNNQVPASVYYKNLKENWLEKKKSKSDMNSIFSQSTPNIDKKLSILNLSTSEDFRYRYRKDYYNNLIKLSNVEKDSIKSEPIFHLERTDGLPPRPPPRRHLTVSSYLSGSRYSLHRKLDVNYFNAQSERSQLATDALFWKPFSWKSGRCRSLTEMYIRKSLSPPNIRNNSFQDKFEKLTNIYCTPKRPPLPIRLKKRNLMNEQKIDKNICQSPKSNVNFHKIYHIRDTNIPPKHIFYCEKEVQTSFQDFDNEYYDDDNYGFANNSNNSISVYTDPKIQNSMELFATGNQYLTMYNNKSPECYDSQQNNNHFNDQSSYVSLDYDQSSYVTLDCDQSSIDVNTLSEIDSLADASLESCFSIQQQQRNKENLILNEAKRIKRKRQIVQDFIDKPDENSDITD